MSDMPDGGDPGPEDLRALGRYIWAAINLEDRVRSLGEQILGKLTLREWAASTIVTKTTDHLKGRQQIASVIAASEWLTASGVLLQRRNEVVHAVPTIYMTLNQDGPPTKHGSMLEHLPIDRTKPVVQTIVLAREFDPMAYEMERQVKGWAEVAADMQRDSGKRDQRPPSGA